MAANDKLTYSERLALAGRHLSRHIRLSALVACSALTLGTVGCVTDTANYRSWPPLTEDDVKSRLNSPDGAVGAIMSPELMQLIQDRTPALVNTAQFMDRLIAAIQEIDESDLSEEEAQLPVIKSGPPSKTNETWSSSLYLRISCLGPNLLTPLTDFSAGEVSMYSPEMTSLRLAHLMAGGQFLLSFQSCILGGLSVDADIPGSYINGKNQSQLTTADNPSDSPAVALALDLQALTKEGTIAPLGIVAFGCGDQAHCVDDMRIAAELRTSTGSYVVKFRLTAADWTGETTLSLIIQGSNGTLNCSLTTSANSTTPTLSCNDP